jgi:hypothetical protein
MRSWFLTAAFAASFVPAIASAAEETWDGGYDLKAERRSGFVASLGLGLGLGSARGYPNEVSKIDDPAFETSTGTAFSRTESLWIGGALRDWFIFGLGFTGLVANAGGHEALGSAFILHVEAFPLFNLGGKWRDLSFYSDFGAGGLTISGGPEKADAGFMSYVAAGSSYELFRFGHFALGPVLAGTYAYSQSAKMGGGYLGLRGTFYGGP